MSDQLHVAKRSDGNILIFIWPQTRIQGLGGATGKCRLRETSPPRNSHESPGFLRCSRTMLRQCNGTCRVVHLLRVFGFGFLCGRLYDWSNSANCANPLFSSIYDATYSATVTGWTWLHSGSRYSTFSFFQCEMVFPGATTRYNSLSNFSLIRWVKQFAFGSCGGLLLAPATAHSTPKLNFWKRVTTSRGWCLDYWSAKMQETARFFFKLEYKTWWDCSANIPLPSARGSLPFQLPTGLGVFSSATFRILLRWWLGLPLFGSAKHGEIVLCPFCHDPQDH